MRNHNFCVVQREFCEHYMNLVLQSFHSFAINLIELLLFIEPSFKVYFSWTSFTYRYIKQALKLLSKECFKLIFNCPAHVSPLRQKQKFLICLKLYVVVLSHRFWMYKFYMRKHSKINARHARDVWELFPWREYKR